MLFVFFVFDTFHISPLPYTVFVTLYNSSKDIILIQVRIVFPALRFGSNTAIWVIALVLRSPGVFACFLNADILCHHTLYIYSVMLIKVTAAHPVVCLVRSSSVAT